MDAIERLEANLVFNNVTISLAVLASFLAWSSLYFILCLVNSKRSYEWHCRMVTCIHAIIISTMSYVFGMYYNPWFITNPGGRNNSLEILTMVICLGYFLFDFLWCLWFHEDTFMCIHHFLTIVCVVMSLVLGISGTEVGAAIFGSEVSNPMLQFRYFMREKGYTKNAVYEINDFLFMAVFIYCRMGIGTYALYYYLLHPAPTLIFWLGSIGLYVVSLIFLYGILRFAYRKYTKMFRSWRAGRAKQLDKTTTNGTAKVGTEQNGFAVNHEHTD